MSETDGSPSADKDLTAELEKWKALARKHEERAKETFAELQKLKESQGSSKSDMDRLVQEIKALREENQKAKRDAMLASVAAKTGLSMAKVRRLQGENEAELLADEIQEIRGVAPIEHGKRRFEAQDPRVFAEQPITD